MTTYKYTLNGVTTNYTKEQLTDYYRSLLKKQNVSEEHLVKLVDSLIARLQKYDGDPYGHLRGNNLTLWRLYHSQEQRGILNVLTPDDRSGL